MTNFNVIAEHAQTKYGDLSGVIQIDGHDNITSLYKLCKDFKFDTKEIFLIGISISEYGTFGNEKLDTVNCSILYVNKSEYGETYIEVEETIKNKKTLNLNKKDFLLKYSELSKYFKRFEIIATSELTKFANTITINEETDFI